MPSPRQIAEERLENALPSLLKRRSGENADAMPAMYMDGLLKGRLDLALRALMGDRELLPAQTFRRIRDKWDDEYYEWRAEDLSSLEVAYLWADGIYIKTGLEHEGSAMLVIVGVLKTGEKKLLACESGYRESKISWLAVLHNLSKRGLRPARLTIADSALGIWPALAETGYCGCKQYCWGHKTRSILNMLPGHLRREASEYIREMLNANALSAAKRWRDIFFYRYLRSYPEATSALNQDWDCLTTFYSFPGEHWLQIRNVNIVDSPFNSLCLKAERPEAVSINEYASPIVWKLLCIAEKYHRKFNKNLLLLDVCSGMRFSDGIARSREGLISAYLPVGGAIAVHAAIILMLALFLPPPYKIEKDLKGVFSVNLHSEHIKGDKPAYSESVETYATVVRMNRNIKSETIKTPVVSTNSNSIPGDGPQVFLNDNKKKDQALQVSNQTVTSKVDFKSAPKTAQRDDVLQDRGVTSMPLQAIKTDSIEEGNKASVDAPALKGFSIRDSQIGADIRMELTAERNLPTGFGISISFKEYASSRRNEPLTEYESANLKKVTPKIISLRSNALIVAVENASEGVYDFVIDCNECGISPVMIDINMKLSGDRKRGKTYTERKIRVSDKKMILKILMPEGIRWDDVEYFDGNIESFESITRYNKNDNLVWREFKR
jgi:transposase-like protein